jgi:hypothetical protein
VGFTAWSVLLLLELYVARSAMRKYRLVVAPVAVMLYVIVVQAMYLTVSLGHFAEYLSDSSVDANRAVFDSVMSAYAILFALARLSLFGLKYSAPLEIAASVRASVLAADKKLGRHQIVFLSVAITLVNVAFLRWEVVYANNEYLLINSPRVYSVHPNVATLLRAALSAAGIYASMLLPVAIQRRNWAKVAALAIPWMVVLSLQLASHSRGAAVTLFITVVTSITIAKQRNLFASLLGGALVLGALVFALVGRILPMHGLAAIGPTVSELYHTIDTSHLYALLVNITQGIFATAESLRLNANHEFVYKVLSVSPLPSAIDGFDQALQCCEIRVNEFVPMSAIGEAISFGAAFYIPIAFFLFLQLRIFASAVCSRPGIVSIFLNVAAFTVFVMANAYPLRNVLRQMLMLLIASVLYRYWRLLLLRRRSRQIASSPSRPWKPV